MQGSSDGLVCLEGAVCLLSVRIWHCAARSLTRASQRSRQTFLFLLSSLLLSSKKQLLNFLNLTHHDVPEGEVEVGVLDEPLGVEGLVLPDLPGDEEADGGEELQLAPLDGALGEEAVQVVHGQAEHLGLRVLRLCNLQHPLRNLLPHLRLHLFVHGSTGLRQEIFLIRLYQV